MKQKEADAVKNKNGGRKSVSTLGELAKVPGVNMTRRKRS